MWSYGLVTTLCFFFKEEMIFFFLFPVLKWTHQIHTKKSSNWWSHLISLCKHSLQGLTISCTGKQFEEIKLN